MASCSGVDMESSHSWSPTVRAMSSAPIDASPPPRAPRSGPLRSSGCKNRARSPTGRMGIARAGASASARSTCCTRLGLLALRQIELSHVQFLLDTLEGGVADRAVVAQFDEALPFGRGGGAQDLDVFRFAVVLGVSLRAAQPQFIPAA